MAEHLTTTSSAETNKIEESEKFKWLTAMSSATVALYDADYFSCLGTNFKIDISYKISVLFYIEVRKVNSVFIVLNNSVFEALSVLIPFKNRENFKQQQLKKISRFIF